MVYRVSDILTWLASKRGERLTTLDTWRQSLSAGFEEETDDAERVRQLVRLYAEVAGPVVGDVRFTPAGFRDYLDSLSSV